VAGFIDTLDRIVRKDLEIRLRIAESDAERDRIRRLRERWTAAVAEFEGQPQATGRHSVMPEDAT
jgi:hypothetical protein